MKTQLTIITADKAAASPAGTHFTWTPPSVTPCSCTGFNTIYDKNLSDGLKKIFAKHQLVWNGAKGPARPDLVLPSKTIRGFDDAITRHTFGKGSCSSAHDLYRQASPQAVTSPGKMSIDILVGCHVCTLSNIFRDGLLSLERALDHSHNAGQDFDPVTPSSTQGP